MKKLIGLLLASTLAVGFTLPAFAAEAPRTSGNVEVSLGTIEELMGAYNLDVQTYENNIRTARYNDDNPEDSLKDYYDNLYDLAKVQDEANIQNAFLSAKQDYLTFCTDNDKLASAQAGAENARKALAVSQQALAAGYTSQKACSDLEDQYNQAQNAVTQLGNQLMQDRSALKTLLNLPSGVTMDIKPVADSDLPVGDIPSINYDADQIVMEGNSSAIKAALLNQDYTQDTAVVNSQLDNASIAVQQARTAQQSAFKKLYDALNSAYTVYEQSLGQVQRKQSELDAEEKSLTAGYASQQSVDAKNQDLQTLRSTLATDRSTLFSAYLSYINMKNGFAAAAAGTQGS